MDKNSFGNIFKITTFGESYSKYIGTVIDGCPEGVVITDEMIVDELEKRSPAGNIFTSQRKEKDRPIIVSGVFEGKTVGSPITILLENQDSSSLREYEIKKKKFRPSHFNLAYFKKYRKICPYAASRFSARETAARVAAAAVAKSFLKQFGIKIFAWLDRIAEISANVAARDFLNIYQSPIYCPDKQAGKKMEKLLLQIRKKKDSIGGVVGFYIDNMKEGAGEPVYKKLNALLAGAIFSIPAVKGFEIGDGFLCALKKASKRNDRLIKNDGKIQFSSNNDGGIVAGIATGAPIYGKVAFKPAATIGQEQKTVDADGNQTTIKIENYLNHDCCVAIRACPVVEAMLALVIADAILMNKVK